MTVYSLLLIIWCQLYFINWKRKCSELRIYWDNYTDEYEIENTRSQFFGEWRKSLITDKYEKYYPKYKRAIQYIISIAIMIPVFAFGFFVNILFMNFDGTIWDGTIFHIPAVSAFSKQGCFFDMNGYPALFIPIVQAQVIALLNRSFQKVALYTTNRENHQLNSHYFNSLILKRYLFEFMDNFTCFFYIAFVNKDLPSLRFYIVIK